MIPTVTAADGTEIAYERHGDGPPIICLHGSGVTRQMWTALVGYLADDATLIVPDRRGRGDSGDSPEYAVERECEDVAALVETLEERPLLLGSSFGGLLAMRAAEDLDVAGLVLYEPPLPAVTVPGSDRRSLAVRMEEVLSEEGRQAAVKLFFQEAAGADNIEHWPIWPECVDLAETIIREAHFVETFDPADVTVSVPTLLLTGDQSPQYLQDGIDVLAEKYNDARIVEIAGAGHAGVATAPEQVATAIREFL